MRMWIVALFCAVASSAARADDDGGPAQDVVAQPGSAEGGSGSGSGSAAAKADDTLDTLRTQPQVPAVRGGTLGIPSVLGTDALQVTQSTQAASSGTAQELPAAIGFDLYTRLGGIRLFDSFAVDILAESYKQLQPHADLMDKPVLPRMMLRELRDIGFRAQRRWGNDTKISVIKSNAARVGRGGSVTASVVDQFIRSQQAAITFGARFLQRSDPGRDVLDFHGAAAELIGQYTLVNTADADTCKATADPDARAKARELKARMVDVRRKNAGNTPATTALDQAVAALSDVDAEIQPTAAPLKDRDLDAVRESLTDASKHIAAFEALADNAAPPRPPVDDTPPQPPLAAATLRQPLAAAVASAAHADTACKTGGYGVTFFLGLSGTMLHTEKRHDDMHNTEDPLFKESRVTLGADLRSTLTGAGTTVLPRVGAYTTLSWATWHDRFTADPNVRQSIGAFQFEGALYVSGHLIGGFDAVVSFVALKSYGHGGMEFLINVAPAIGAALGGK